MMMKKMLYKVKPPCYKCPYKLGVIKTLTNPCPMCMLNGYSTFEQFRKQLSREPSIKESENR